MCKITLNAFTCTKSHPSHLLLDHTYLLSVCPDRDFAPQNLNRYCVNAITFIKTLDYACEGCLLPRAKERREVQKMEYVRRRRELEEVLEGLVRKMERRTAGGEVCNRMCFCAGDLIYCVG